MSFFNNSFQSNTQLPTPRSGSPQAGGLSEDMLNLNAGVGRQMGGMVGSQGFLGNPSFNVQGQGEVNMGVDDAQRLLGQGGQLMPDLDMMALLRAKQKLMMNRGGNASSSTVQDKIRAFTQDQFAKGQGLPMTRPEDFQVSSAMIDKLKRSSEEMNSDDNDLDEPKGKKRKKTKKPNDMPRRALSAYNIFFSEQREQILKEIDSKDKKDDGKEDESKDGSEAKEDKEVKKEDEKVKEGDENKPDEAKEGGEAKDDGSKKEEDSEVPNVMNRTFFPTRAKRAHRKVHGKIGLVSLAREVSARWKALSDEKRKHYQGLAEKDRERHKKVMADYQERKAAENMISMGSPAHESQEAPDNQMQRLPTEQELRDSMAHQYQQRILAEMMAARQQQAAAAAARQQQPQQAMMGMGGVMGMGNMVSQQLNSFSSAPAGNLGLQTDPSLLGLNSVNNQTRAQMWQQMGMGPL